MKLRKIDYPVPVSGVGLWMAGRLDWKDKRKITKEQSILQRDYLFKKAIGFSEETFTRMDEILSNVKGSG